MFINLLVFVVLFGFVVCTISGIVGFFCDIRRFKSDIEFSGNRKQLIHYLMFGADEEKVDSEDEEKVESEVKEDEN